ncbi:MAG: ABC transporter ATP-binding protein [Thermodesulfovibrionales bacterium]
MNDLLSAVAVTKQFKTAAGELQVLREINLTVRTAEMVGIIGASGAGKSTLLHILGALDRPTSGRIIFNNRDLAGLDDQALAGLRNTEIGFVFQFHHLLPEFTALENVVFPGLIGGRSFGDVQKEAEKLLGELGLARRLRHRPGELSGGEQQRVAVARALIQNPRIVLADEPTGNLDTATGNDLFELFIDQNKKRGVTFVIVTHNTALSGRCHRVIEMADGMILPG